MTSQVQKFVIPKKKRIVSADEEKIENKNDVQLRTSTSEEKEKLTEDIFSTLSQKMLRKYFDVTNIQMVENPLLTERFNKMKNTLRGVNYRTETLGFILIGSNDEELTRIINSGLSTDYSLFSDVGVAKQGVPVCRFIDQITPAPFFPNLKLRIICFKTLRGKSMEVGQDSSHISPLPTFNSHIVHSSHVQWNNLTTLEKFRTSVVYHFELDPNGHSVKNPSGLLPYAVFDLVPNYGGKKVARYAMSRLWPSYELDINASVVPSTGIFTGSRCKLWALSGNGTVPPILDLSLLHVQEEFYTWKKLWKISSIAALMKRENWGKLLKGREFQIEVDRDTKPFVSYWGFNSDLPLFPNLTAGMESLHMGLIGHCGDTILFILPNGQLASSLGLPCVNISTTNIVHCIAINAKYSAVGILQSHREINCLERSISSVCCQDFVSYDCIARHIHGYTEPHPADSNFPQEDIKVSDVPSGRLSPQDKSEDQGNSNTADDAKYQLYRAYGLVPSTLYQDQYVPANSVDDGKAAAVPSSSSTSTTSDNISEDVHNVIPTSDDQSFKDVETDVSGEDEFLDPNDLDYDLLFGEKELHIIDECAEEQMATSENIKHEMDMTENTLLAETTKSASIESINHATMPVTSSTENELITPEACVKEEADDLMDVETPSSNEDTNNLMDYNEYEARPCYEMDPIMKSVINYMKTPPAPKIYNGCLERGIYFTEGSERHPLLPTPPTGKIGVGVLLSKEPSGSNLPRPRRPSLSLPQPKLVFREALLPLPRITPLSQIKIEHPPVFPSALRNKNADLTHQFQVIVDSDIMLGQLKSDDLQMMLRRLKVDKLLTHLPHRMMYHESVDVDIREIIRNPDTPADRRKCMQDYLRLLESYGREGFVTHMAPHKCNNKSETDKIHCLRFTVGAARRENRFVKVFYLTDMENCKIQREFDDPRLAFVNYDSWIKIFE